jgi:hypothetical protein
MKPRYDGKKAERSVALKPFRVVSADGRVLSGSNDLASAERTAAAMGNGARVEVSE